MSKMFSKIHDEESKTLFLELMFFSVDGNDIIPSNQESIKIQLDCKDVNTEIEASFFSFSENDKTLLENHCIFYHEKTKDDELQASYELCQSGELTQYAKDRAFQCVYSEINFSSMEGKSKNFKTCFPFSTGLIKNGKLHEFLKEYLDLSYYENFPNESNPIYEFTVKGNGISASYDYKKVKVKVK